MKSRKQQIELAHIAKKRRSLFEAQDKVDHQREALISGIEGKLTQRTGLKTLFTIRWKLL